MQRTDLTEALMAGWSRLDGAAADFFEAFVKAALRLDRLEPRAWLRRRLQNPPLAAPIDPASLIFADADLANLLGAAGRAPGEDAAGPDGTQLRRVASKIHFNGVCRLRTARIEILPRRPARTGPDEPRPLA